MSLLNRLVARVRRHPFRLVCVVLLLLLLAFAVHVFFSEPMIPTGPVRMVDSGSGEIRYLDGPPTRPWLTTAISLASRSVEVDDRVPWNHVDGFFWVSRLDCRHVAIFCKSEHPGVVLAAHLLQKKLLGVPEVERVDLYPGTCTPEPGSPAPGLRIWVDGDGTDKGVWRREETLSVGATFRALPVQDYFEFFEQIRPRSFAWMSVNIDMHVDARVETTGINSGGMWMYAPAEAVAGRIFETFVEALDTARLSNGLMPKVPRDWYPDYDPTPKLAILDDTGAQLRMSCVMPMQRNLSVYTFEVGAFPGSFWKWIAPTLDKDGWRPVEEQEEDEVIYPGSGPPIYSTVFRSDTYPGAWLCIEEDESKRTEKARTVRVIYGRHLEDEQVDRLRETVLQSDAPAALVSAALIPNEPEDVIGRLADRVVRQLDTLDYPMCIYGAGYLITEDRFDEAKALLERAERLRGDGYAAIGLRLRHFLLRVNVVAKGLEEDEDPERVLAAMDDAGAIVWQQGKQPGPVDLSCNDMVIVTFRTPEKDRHPPYIALTIRKTDNGRAHQLHIYRHHGRGGYGSDLDIDPGGKAFYTYGHYVGPEGKQVPLVIAELEVEDVVPGTTWRITSHLSWYPKGKPKQRSLK